MDNSINLVGATDPGSRDHNEDSFVADNALGLGLVADGMGGYACGEVASELVRETLLEAAANNESLTEAIARAHKVVKQASVDDDSRNGMGSTVIAVKVRDLDYEIAWVGDSRAYLWDGELKQITRDHSYVEALLGAGAITPAQALNHPNRNLITQAVGAAGAEGLEISVVYGRLSQGQQLLLCSDGLVDEVNDTRIARLLNQAISPEEKVKKLIDAALKAGGRDNITIILGTAETSGSGSKDKETVVPYIIRTTTITGQSTRHDVRPISDSETESAPDDPSQGWWQNLLERLLNRPK